MQQYMWQKLCKNNKKVNKKNKNNGFKPLAATVLLKRQFLKKQICLPECLQALLLLLSHLQAPHLAKHLPALLSPEKSRDESYTFNSKIKKLIQVKMHHRASSSYSVSGNTHKRTLFWFYYTWWKIFLHIREKKTNAQTCLINGRTDLAGADLSVNVRLLPDAVLQVRDVGLEPVPVADDGSSLHGVAALCSLPSAGGDDTSV